jgi:hypothetical protein
MAGTRRIRRAAQRRRARAWRRVQRGGVLSALSASSLALPGLAVHASELGEIGVTADFKWARYVEDEVTSSRVESGSNSRYEIDVYQAAVGFPVTERVRLDFEMAYEEMTGATPRYLTPDENGDPLLVMTQASIDEARTDLLGKSTLLFDRGSAALSTGVSWENDYLAINGGIEGERSFNEKNTTLSGGFGVSIDRITPTDAEEFQRDDEENKQTGSVFAGIAQVLGRNAAIQGTLQYQLANGFLDDPYKQAFVVSTSTPEPDTRPDMRHQLSLLTRYRHHIGFLRGTLHADYRFYYDDWNINAHTFEVSWYQMLWSSFRLIPSVRYYSQSQADFYAPFYQNERSDGLYSSDYRLSPFGALTWRVKGEMRFQLYNLDMLMNLAYERYMSSGSLALGDVETANPGLVDFEMFSAGLTTRF